MIYIVIGGRESGKTFFIRKKLEGVKFTEVHFPTNFKRRVFYSEVTLETEAIFIDEFDKPKFLQHTIDYFRGSETEFKSMLSAPFSIKTPDVYIEISSEFTFEDFKSWKITGNYEVVNMENKEFKKGDLTFDLVYGDCRVANTLRLNGVVSLQVSFSDNDESLHFYTEDGRRDGEQQQSLFHRGEVTIKQNEFIRMSTDDMPVYENQMVYRINISGGVFETKADSWNKDGNMYVVKENAEKAIVKRFPLPDWIDCCYFFLDKTKVMVCVENMAFSINENIWIKEFCETSQFDSCELEEVKSETLKIGDWVVNGEELYGLVSNTIRDDNSYNCVVVNEYGECRDEPQMFKEGLYRKITPRR